MTEKDLILGEEYLHREHSGTVYLAIKLNTYGKDWGRTTLLISKDTDPSSAFHTVYPTSEQDPEFWSGFYSRKPQPSRFTLNDKYVAEIAVDKETVKVGCQTFDARTVLALADKLRK